MARFQIGRAARICRTTQPALHLPADDCWHQQSGKTQSPRLTAASKHFLIQRHQQTVQNRAVCIQKFVEKNDVGFRQHTLGVRLRLTVAQSTNVEWSEQFRWICESLEQIVEDTTVQPRRQRSHDRALRRAGWSKQKQVFASNKTDANRSMTSSLPTYSLFKVARSPDCNC